MMKSQTQTEETSNKAIVIQNLCKNYEENKILKNINLTIKKGSFVALLGKNGAGKTTLINCLSGISLPNQGEVVISGHHINHDPQAAKQTIGVVEQELAFDPFFSPWEIMRLRRGFFGLPSDDQYLSWVLKKVVLYEKKNVPARFLSGGMKRRLMIAKALAHAPKILILDEPTAGVDVDLRQELYNFMRELSQMGTTILLTTHYLEEAELLAETVAILHNGCIISHTDMSTLLKYNNREIKITDQYGKTHHKELPIGQNINQVLRQYTDIRDIQINEPSLEKVFMHITKN